MSNIDKCPECGAIAYEIEDTFGKDSLLYRVVCSEAHKCRGDFYHKPKCSYRGTAYYATALAARVSWNVWAKGWGDWGKEVHNGV